MLKQVSLVFLPKTACSALISPHNSRGKAPKSSSLAEPLWSRVGAPEVALCWWQPAQTWVSAHLWPRTAAAIALQVAQTPLLLSSLSSPNKRTKMPAGLQATVCALLWQRGRKRKAERNDPTVTAAWDRQKIMEKTLDFYCTKASLWGAQSTLLRTPHRGSSPPAVSSERTWSKQKGSDQTPPAHTEGPWEAKQINLSPKMLSFSPGTGQASWNTEHAVQRWHSLKAMLFFFVSVPKQGWSKWGTALGIRRWIGNRRQKIYLVDKSVL